MPVRFGGGLSEKAQQWDLAGSLPSHYAPWDPKLSRPPDYEAYHSTHGDGANLVYCDGHTKYKPYRLLRSGDFGLVPDEAYEPTLAQSNKKYHAAF